MMKWEGTKDGLHLFTVAEFDRLPDGIEVESIMKDKKIKGKDVIDMDTRANHTAWGVRDPWNHPEKNLFLTFLLMA